VAVAPTLVAKSQLSLSVRGMAVCPPRNRTLLSQYNDRRVGIVPASRDPVVTEPP
jgi:hypothetical protein